MSCREKGNEGEGLVRFIFRTEDERKQSLPRILLAFEVEIKGKQDSMPFLVFARCASFLPENREQRVSDSTILFRMPEQGRDAQITVR